MINNVMKLLKLKPQIKLQILIPFLEREIQEIHLGLPFSSLHTTRSSNWFVHPTMHAATSHGPFSITTHATPWEHIQNRDIYAIFIKIHNPSFLYSYINFTMKHFYIPTLLTFTLQTQSFHLPSLGSLIHHSPQKTNTAASQASNSVAPEHKLPLPQTTPQPQQPCGSAHASSPTQMGHCIPSTDKSSCYWLNDWRCGWGSVCCWEKRQDLDGIVEGDGKAEFEDRGVVVGMAFILFSL